MLPQDPNMLLSYVNLKLRDQYSSLEDLLDDLDIDREDFAGQLNNAGIYYDSNTNQLKVR